MLILSPIKVLISAAFLSMCVFSAAYSFDTKARAAYLIDQTSGAVLLSKNSDLPLPPASMSKLMTLYMTFEFIKAGKLSLDEKLPVSKTAANYTGSTMFLNPTDRVAVLDLIRGIIVLSGNDACAVLAEALSPDGTEAGFAKLMTQRAKQIGLENSTFKNSNGWPANGHLMSVRDLGILAQKLITDFPEYYPMFAEQTYKFDGRAPANTRNRNPLLGLGIGADGLKTGHTKEAGYGLVGSAEQDGRRIIFVLSGLNNLEDRAQEAETIVNWAFRQFTMEKFATDGSEIGKEKVWNGKSRDVSLVLENDLNVMIPVLSSSKPIFSIEYVGPIKAPIKKGDKIAELLIKSEDLPETRHSLLAGNSVPRGGFFVQVRTAGQYLVNMLFADAEESL
ncbi:MAG: D-alanyl-D-alanine carboxypeptidase [Paracoccaceae bacterium]|nr:D-alanyl-D-alanine carboxypeptidase [Paracoccaceae bacterium]